MGRELYIGFASRDGDVLAGRSYVFLFVDEESLSMIRTRLPVMIKTRLIIWPIFI